MTGPKTFADFGIELPNGYGGEVDTTCPQCSPRRKHSRAKCLSVNTVDGVWYCQHCLWSGSLGQGQRTTSDPDPYGAPLKAKEWQPPRPIPAVTIPTLWDRAVKWFNERSIPDSVLSRNGVTSAEEWCPVCEERRNHILFPYVRDGVHVNTKHRCPLKHFRMEKGAERVFYGLTDVIGQTAIVIVEGEIDKLSCEVAGFVNTLSVPDGAPSPDAQNYSSKFAFLESAEALFTTITKVILATDADAPGETLCEELARRIGREKCYRVTWPLGIKDANECLVQAGPEALRSCLESAEPYPIEGVVFVDDMRADLDQLYDRGFDPGVESGWFKFDRHYRARTGLLTVVTGIPGHGKSTFLDALLVNLAVRHGWPIGICSPENQPLARHHAGILAKYLGKPFHLGPTDRMTKTEMHMARDWSAQFFGFVLPEEPTLDAILERGKALVYRMGIKGFVIDPWNEIENVRPPSKTETEWVSECLGKMRRFARHHNVHVWLVAHPTKMAKEDGGGEPIPKLWDISGSAHFRNKADAGLTVWRDMKRPEMPVQVHVTKIRFAETGETGMVEFTFDRVTGRYREAA